MNNDLTGTYNIGGKEVTLNFQSQEAKDSYKEFKEAGKKLGEAYKKAKTAGFKGYSIRRNAEMAYIKSMGRNR